MNKSCSAFLRCSLMVKSYCCFLDPAVRQRVAFEAVYKADCSVLSDPVGKEILMTTAKGYGPLVQNICGAGKNYSCVYIAETVSNIIFAKILIIFTLNQLANDKRTKLFVADVLNF